MKRTEYLAFVSHCGDDTWIARKIAECLEGAGGKAFLDLRDIAIGAEFEAEMRKALKCADELIVLATPWSMSRPYIWLEIGAAWYRRIPIVVLLLGFTTSEFRQRIDIPVTLHARNLLHLNDADRFFEQFRRRANSQEGG